MHVFSNPAPYKQLSAKMLFQLCFGMNLANSSEHNNAFVPELYDVKKKGLISSVGSV